MYADAKPMTARDATAVAAAILRSRARAKITSVFLLCFLVTPIRLGDRPSSYPQPAVHRQKMTLNQVGESIDDRLTIKET